MNNLYELIKDKYKDIAYLKNLSLKYRSIYSDRTTDNLKCAILLNSIICASSTVPCKQNTKNYIIKGFKKLHDNLSQREFAEFCKDLHFCIYPKTISTYGFPNSIKFYMQNPESLSRIHKTINLLEELNYEYFISYGTLLGYIRNKSLIDYDNDVDIVVKINPKSHSGVQDELTKLKNDLENKGLNCWWGQDRAITIVKVGNGYGDKILRLDLFPWWNINGINYIWPGIMDGISNEDIYPLQKINFLDTSMFIMNNPTKLLEINYGPNWQIPDMSWTFDWNEPMAKYRALIQNEH